MRRPPPGEAAGDRAFHRSFWPFFLVLVAQNIVTVSVNLLDNVMLGAYSEAALAGAAAVNQIQFVLLSVVNGAGDGLVVLGSQYWGQNRTGPIQRLTATALWLCAGISTLLFLLVSLFPRGVVGLFTTSEAIARAGMEYLSVIRFTYPIFAVTAILLAMLRGVETVKIAMVISLTAFGVNGLLNYALIYGNFGAPAMGAKGAAVATLVARVVELLIVMGYLALRDKKLAASPGLLLKPERGLARDYFRVGVPTLLVGLQWGVNVALQTVVLGHMTGSAIAANSIAVNLTTMLKVIAIASSAAAGVLIGKTVGQGDLPRVKRYAKLLQAIFLGIGLVTFTGTMLLRGPVLSLYNVSAETRAMAWSFLTVLAVSTIGMAYQMPVLTGIVRGGGDTRFVLINDMISVWGIVIPLSFLAAFSFDWPPVAVVACLHSDQVFKCLPAAVKVNSYNWIKTLTRAV